jgi:hypothetical protein
MVDKHMLGLINDALKLARGSQAPWGGVNMLVCGDLWCARPWEGES